MESSRMPQDNLTYYLGGRDLLPAALSGEPADCAALYLAIKRGLPVRVALVMRERIPRKVFDRVIPRTTLESKRHPDARLSSQQSERILRIARVYARAAEVFGDRQRGETWMARPNPALGGHAPAQLLDSETGARAIEQVLGQMEHGIAA